MRGVVDLPQCVHEHILIGLQPLEVLQDLMSLVTRQAYRIVWHVIGPPPFLSDHPELEDEPGVGVAVSIDASDELIPDRETHRKVRMAGEQERPRLDTVDTPVQPVTGFLARFGLVRGVWCVEHGIDDHEASGQNARLSNHLREQRFSHGFR